MRLYNTLPAKLTSKLNCLALEEKRIGEVSMDPTLCTDFLMSYKRKLKDNFLAIEFKVRRLYLLLFATKLLRFSNIQNSYFTLYYIMLVLYFAL